MRFKSLAPLVLVICLSPLSRAEDQASKEDPFAAMKTLYKEIEEQVSARLDRGDYLGAATAARAFIEREQDRRRLAFLLDLSASYFAALGDDVSARLSMTRSQNVALAHSGPETYPGDWKRAAAETRWKDPGDVIREAAKRHDVIMLSEAHHVPEHRAFGASLLPLFKKLGFRYLAMEALSNPQVDSNFERVARNPGPGTAGGYYFVEPQMAELVREALRLGFTLVPYEDRGSDDRELSQAKNLYEAVLKNEPDAKVLVWAGYGHVYKRALSGWKTMGAHLWELTGKEPFSLFQVYDTLDPYGPNHQLFYEPLVSDAKRPLRKPMVLLNRPGLYPALDKVAGTAMARTEAGEPAVDGYIVHPPLVPRAEGGLRPGWMDVLLKNRVRVEGRLPEALRGGSRLVQAFPAAEGTDASPADQMRPSSDGGWELRLRPGDYVLRVRDADGGVLLEEPLEAGR